MVMKVCNTVLGVTFITMALLAISSAGIVMSDIMSFLGF